MIKVIPAKNFVNGDESIIDSAKRIAVAVRDALLNPDDPNKTDHVRLSVFGLRGTDTTFFNVILFDIGDLLAASDFNPNGRFDILTETNTQQSTYNRCLQAHLSKIKGG